MGLGTHSFLCLDCFPHTASGLFSNVTCHQVVPDRTTSPSSHTYTPLASHGLHPTLLGCPGSDILHIFSCFCSSNSAATNSRKLGAHLSTVVPHWLEQCLLTATRFLCGVEERHGPPGGVADTALKPLNPKAFSTVFLAALKSENRSFISHREGWFSAVSFAFLP